MSNEYFVYNNPYTVVFIYYDFMFDIYIYEYSGSIVSLHIEKKMLICLNINMKRALLICFWYNLISMVQHFFFIRGL